MCRYFENTNVFSWHSKQSPTVDAQVQMWWCGLTVNPDWPVYSDIFCHPPRLPSWRPIWSDVSPSDISERWEQDWLSASAVNYVLVTDRATHEPVFNLPRRSWFLLYRFQTDQGLCQANLCTWSLATSDLSWCGQWHWQMMNHSLLSSFDQAWRRPAAHTQRSNSSWLQNTMSFVVKSKVLSRASRAHGAALISVSLTLSRTPTEDARPRIRG